MKISERTLRISAASFLALVFISAAYLLSGPSFLTTASVNAESTEELLQEYSTKDTDADTLSDWQEALYGTDPKKADTDGDGVSDGEAARTGKLTPNALAAQLPGEDTTPPSTEEILSEIPGVDPAAGSITEQFSQEFLQEILNATSGEPPTDEQKQEITNSLFAKYTARAGALLTSKYSAVSVRTNPSLSVTNYAGAVEQIFYDNDVSEDANQPILLISSIVQNDDADARKKLKILSDSYGAIRDDLLALSVPPSQINSHLALIQGFDALQKATAGVTRLEEDPLAVMGGLSVYQPASIQIMNGLKSIATSILATGEPVSGQPGYVIVNIARSTENI